jgi:hypothetical protein
MICFCCNRQKAGQHPAFAPAIHACVERVPVAKARGQATLLAALLGYVQNRVEHLPVIHAHVAALTRKTIGYSLILAFGDFHPPFYPEESPVIQLVLTRLREFRV